MKKFLVDDFPDTLYITKKIFTMNLQRKATLTIIIKASKKKFFRKTSKKSTAIQKIIHTFSNFENNKTVQGV